MCGRRKGDKAGEVGRSKVMEGLAYHSREFGLYLEDDGCCEPLKKDLSQAEGNNQICDLEGSSSERLLWRIG